VAFDPESHREVRAQLASSTPIRIFQGIQVLHQRGYHRVRALPGLGGSGMWRVTVTTADNLTYEHGFLRLRDNEAAIKYSIGGLTEFASGEVTVTTSPGAVATSS
jgi:hypothetical protein